MSFNPKVRPTIEELHAYMFPGERSDAVIRHSLEVIHSGGTDRDFVECVDPRKPERHRRLRLEAFFDTVCSMVYSESSRERMSEDWTTLALPYWKFMTVGDGQVRPAHAALDGFMARWDDPVWNKIFPPLGICCRCTVVSALESEADERVRALPGLKRLPEAAQSLPDWSFDEHACFD